MHGQNVYERSVQWEMILSLQYLFEPNHHIRTCFGYMKLKDNVCLFQWFGKIFKKR